MTGDLRWVTVETSHGGLGPAIRDALRAQGLRVEDVVKVQLVARDSERAQCEFRDAFPGTPCQALSQGLPGGRQVAALVWACTSPISRGQGVTSAGWGTARLYFLDAVTSGPGGTAGRQWARCFEVLGAALRRARLDFADLVKLWTFYGTASGEAHFTEFSTCRNEVFDGVRFTLSPDGGGRGLPASTGVRVTGGEAVLGAVAATGASACALSNPLQTDPYRYPDRPALFSRGVRVQLDGAALLLASGTASVLGGAVTHEGSATAQAEQVLALLDVLAGPARYGYLLAYVRDRSDAPAVRGVLRHHHRETPTLLVQARLSRPGLLVEIDSAAYQPRTKA